MKTRIGIAVLATFLLVPAVPASAINIYSGDIVDGEVKTVDLDSNAVTSAKILNGEVKTADLGVDAVTTNKILNGTIGTDDLANGAVTDAKIGGQISASKINSAGLNADTLDGIDSTGFAPVSHAHAQSDVTGLAAALAGKADVSHDHDAVYQRKYTNVIVVSTDGNGDFLSPKDAVDSILDASPTNPYLVKIMPGVYDIGSSPLTMKAYVDCEGSGKNVTRIVGSGSTTWAGLSSAVVLTADNAELRKLTIENLAPPSAEVGAAILNWYNSATVKDVAAISQGGQYPIAVISNNASPFLDRVTIVATGNNATGLCTTGTGHIALENLSISAQTSGGGFGIGVYHFGGSAALANVTIVGSQSALLVVGGSSLQIEHSALSGGLFSLQIEGGQDHAVKVGSSKLIGTVQPAFQNLAPICAAAYNGNYSMLDASCQCSCGRGVR